jgi:hypothetical protein
MRARRDFGYDATKGAVMILLPGQGMAEDCPVGPHDCGCGLVAA